MNDEIKVSRSSFVVPPDISSRRFFEGRFVRYWSWRTLLQNYFILRRAPLAQKDLQELAKLRKQIFLTYLKNFLWFPLLFLKLLTPSYMKGEVNVWTNLRTLWQTLTSREFRPLRMAVLMQFVFLYVVGHLGYIVFHNYAAPAYAATYTWIQNSWAGNASTTATGVHPGNQTGWNYFVSKDAEIIISGGAVTLELPSSFQIETTDTHFNAGTKTNVFTSSTGSGASIVLLKPGGATCSSGTQCTSGICTSNLCYVPPCGVGVTSTLYSSETYPLVNIGTQCWFAKNLNVGTKLASAATVPSNGALIEKWCYDNSDANCTTYGGLYTWAETLQLDPSCNTSNSGGCIPGANRQGICPSGWHIPTDTEIKTMEVYLGMCTGGGAGCVDTTSWRGTDQSTQLKTGGSSGFNLPVGAGRRSTGNAFQGQSTYTYLWSASASTATDAWYRQFTTRADIFRDVLNKAYGSSVRCIKDA